MNATNPSVLHFDHRPILRVLLAWLLLAWASFVAADSALRTTQVKIAGHALRVEVAATEEQRAKGLMYRQKMAPDDGMLFIFGEPGYHSMWMKNTFIPLSVAFLDAQGTILNIRDMEPQVLDPHMSAGPSIYAIETNKGWFAKKGIKAGDKVTGLPPPR